jgi:mannitol/fructose-specific phosphotransferase system IIA component (Ntr-type)
VKSLLNALQEGRLIELPASEKDKCLEYLALLIEAVPDIQTDMDMVTAVKEREATVNTCIGKGVACPHVRGTQEGELLCAVGWAPKGIDYGPNCEKVHLIVMYYIPDSQKNAYLKEISGLAKALSNTDEIQALTQIEDIQSLRSTLLDWVEMSMNTTAAGAVARMIKLEEKTGELAELEIGKKKFRAVSFQLLKTEDGRVFVLTHDPKVLAALEKNPATLQSLTNDSELIIENYQVAVLDVKNFSLGRLLLDCVAIQGIEAPAK